MRHVCQTKPTTRGDEKSRHGYSQETVTERGLTKKKLLTLRAENAAVLEPKGSTWARRVSQERNVSQTIFTIRNDEEMGFIAQCHLIQLIVTGWALLVGQEKCGAQNDGMPGRG